MFNRKRWLAVVVGLGLVMVVALWRLAGPLLRSWSAAGSAGPAILVLPPPEIVATPAGIDDLKQLQQQVDKALSIVQPAVVAVRHTRRDSAASGVIISPDGYVLSQYHVTHAVRDGSAGTSWKAGEKTVVILNDGRECAAELLGATLYRDISLLKIVEPGPFPCTPLSKDVRPALGEWLLKLGHPGHYQVGRPAMVRLGRVLSRNEDGFVTDCLINGGDSGGPYFDLEGRLAGIVRGSTADLATIVPSTPDEFNRNYRYVFSGTSNRRILEEMASMKAGDVIDRGGPFDIGLVKAQRLPDRDWTQGSATRAAFRELAEGAKASVVTVMNGPAPVAFGSVVAQDDGLTWVVTKASELPPEPSCKLPDGMIVAAEVVGVDQFFDLALLKIAADDLRVVNWADDFSPKPGTLVASVGGAALPFAIGVVSIPRTNNPVPQPVRIDYPIREPAARLPLLGHAEPGRGFVVDEIFEGRVFDAGIRLNDAIVSAGGRPFQNEGDLAACVAGMKSGDLLTVEIERSGERRTLQLSLTPARAVVGANYFSGGFPTTFEHASPVQPHECGGPVVDLQGRVLGITIARSNPQSCMAIPGDVVQRRLDDLLSGKLKDSWKPSN